jgi:hypothetical protein
VRARFLLFASSAQAVQCGRPGGASGRVDGLARFG